MTIAFAADHAGFKLKEDLMVFAKEKGYQIIDCGTFSEDSCDYPDFALKAGEAIKNNSADRAVVVCGSGIGVSIVANKVEGVRCALCFNVEMAKLSRMHNNANAIAFGARFIDWNVAKDSMIEFLNTDFEGGRHQRRVDKIHSLTNI